MDNMIRIGKSKVPLAHQLPAIADNLQKKTGKSCLIAISVWSHKSVTEELGYKISFVPGFGEECTQFHPKTWSEMLDKYFSLMRS